MVAAGVVKAEEEDAGGAEAQKRVRAALRNVCTVRRGMCAATTFAKKCGYDDDHPCVCVSQQTDN